MERRLDSIYDEIYEREDNIEECENRLQKSKQDAVSLEVVLELLDSFEDIYDTMSNKEKRELMKALVSEIHLLPSKEQKEKQRFIKSMIFNFPIDKSVLDCLRVSNHGVETVCLLSKLNAKQHIEVEIKMDELDLTAAESKATYEEIKEYVLEHSGMKVSSLYIAQVKQKCGIIERENYNKPKSEDAKQPQCPPEKEKAIMEALKHFGMI